MRVSTAEFFRLGINSILDQQGGASKTQQQLSSGKRFSIASEDPAAAASAQRIRARLTTLITQTDNITHARSDLNMEEQALDNITRVLDQAREAALASANGANNSINLANQGKLVRELLDDLVSTANSRDANNNYLFAGYSNGNQPFSRDANNNLTFTGSQDQRTLSMGNGREMAVSDSGFKVFQNLKDGNGDFATRPLSSNTGSGIIDPGEVVTPALYDGQNYSITLGSKTAFSDGGLAFTDTGGNDTLGYSLEINGTVVDTLAEGDNRTLTQIATNITAQNGTTGVSAFVDSGVLYLVNDSQGSGPITIKETLTGASDPGDEVIGFLGKTLKSNGSSVLTEPLSNEADSFIVRNASNALVTAGTYTENADIAFAGVRTHLRGDPNNGDHFTVTPSANHDMFSTLNTMALALEGTTDTTTGRAELQNSLNQVIKQIDTALARVDNIRTGVGTRLQSLDSLDDTNSGLDIQLRQTLSDIEDLDIASAATKLSEQVLSLQAAQQSFIRIQGLNLFDLL